MLEPLSRLSLGLGLCCDHKMLFCHICETLRNLLFNANRETADTGAIYTYDRLVFEFIGKDGAPTVVPQQRTIRGNMILANYGCAWPLGTLL